MSCAVVILNYNTRNLLNDFLPPLLDSIASCEGAKVYVADNGSSDGSLQLLRACFPEVGVVELEKNFGFTGGYNRAIAQILEETDYKYITLINSDILVSNNWLKALIAHLDAVPSCGICGPKLHALNYTDGAYSLSDYFEYAGAAGGWLDRFGFPFCSGRVLGRREIDKGQYDGTRSVMWVSGACLVTRSELWKKLDGLDERFFAHMEEIDYCWRAQALGYSADIVTDSVLWHLGGATLSASSPLKLKLNFRNSLLMLEKNLGAGFVRKRIWIDRFAAMAYLLSFQWSKAQAVFQAHKEFEKERRREAEVQKTSRLGANNCAAKPYGMLNISIIIQAVLRGERIFEYLRGRC